MDNAVVGPDTTDPIVVICKSSKFSTFQSHQSTNLLIEEHSNDDFFGFSASTTLRNLFKSTIIACYTIPLLTCLLGELFVVE